MKRLDKHAIRKLFGEILYHEQEAINKHLKIKEILVKFDNKSLEQDFHLAAYPGMEKLLAGHLHLISVKQRIERMLDYYEKEKTEKADQNLPLDDDDSVQ